MDVDSSMKEGCDNMSEQENRAAAQAQDAKAEKKPKAPAKKKDKSPTVSSPGSKTSKAS